MNRPGPTGATKLRQRGYHLIETNELTATFDGETGDWTEQLWQKGDDQSDQKTRVYSREFGLDDTLPGNLMGKTRGRYS